MRAFLSALLAAPLLSLPAAAASLYLTAGEATVVIDAADPGLTFTYAGSTDLAAFASGDLGTFASAGVDPGLTNTPEPFATTDTLRVTSLVNGTAISGPSPNLADSFAQILGTIAFQNTTEIAQSVTFSVIYTLLAQATTDGAPGQSAAGVTVLDILVGDGTVESWMVEAFNVAPDSAAGTIGQELSDTRSFTVTVGAARSLSFSVSLNSQGYAEALLPAVIPLPATAPALLLALCGLPALAARRRRVSATRDQA